MKNIKEIIENAAIEDKLFFSFKDKEQLKKIFRILKSVGFKWMSGADLSDNNLLNTVLLSGCFTIEKKGIGYGSESILSIRCVKKNIFDLFKELDIVVNDRTKQFDHTKIDCLSSIITKNGANARIIATDFKRGLTPLVVALSFNGENEKLSLSSNNGVLIYEDAEYNLVFKDETIELKQVEMTVNEIEKALGVNNLKIVK